MRSLRMAVSFFLLALLSSFTPAAAERRGPEEYAVWLQEPPSGKRLPRALRSPGGRIRVDPGQLEGFDRAVEASQAPILSAVRNMGLPVTGSTRRLLNAVFVRATPEQARQLKAMPGVRGVVRMQRYKRLLNTGAELINALQAWEAAGGVNRAGEGVIIGIFDTGIDPTHPAFQAPELAPPPGYPRARPEDLPFTNNKIIVARSYLRPGPGFDPRFSRPDDYSPRDNAGHGTFVAMIAAGRRVTAPGGITLTGIAPGAFLASYKVLGSTDINDFARQSAVLQAMDDAVSDGVDIMNLSIGGIALFAPDDRGFACSNDPTAICDPLAEAVQIATEDFGILVVVAAGNDGDRANVFPTLNAISSPGTAAAALSVGATTNSRQLFATLRGGPGSPASLQSVPAVFGNNPRPPGNPLTAPIRDAESTGNDGFACSPLQPGSLTGRIVLIRRGDCEFEDKILNAQAAGAVAAVVTNSVGFETPITMTGLVNATIPSVMIGAGAGASLRDWVRSTGSATVTLDPQLTPRTITADTVARFSSRGPGIDFQLKPDVVAPGTAIYAGVATADPNGSEFDAAGFTTLEGTSFAAPFVAGTAAIAWQRNPRLTAPLIKSAVVNRASASITENEQRASVLAVGAGKVNARASIDPGVTAEPVSVSFGVLNSSTRFPIERRVRLTNVGGSTETFRILVAPRGPEPSARIMINGGTGAMTQLSPGQSATLVLTLTGTVPRPGVYEGELQVSASPAALLIRIPYQFLVGSGQPAGIFAIVGDGQIGTVGQPSPELLILKLVDEFGVPVANVDVQFRATQGGGQVVEADARTDIYGIAAADVDLGASVGEQIFTATAGGLTATFSVGARAMPSINDGGMVNGASFARGQAVAPGSIISIFGSNLAEAVRGASRTPLPRALYHVSVSFDHPDDGLSVAGRLFFISPGQINVQVPWEFAGRTFALVKVRINDTTSAVHRLELSDYAPGIFEYEAEGRKLGVVTHPDGTVVTPSSPARPGETVIVYATGVGPTDRPQTTGEPASAEPLARTAQVPAASVAGQNAAVQFSGLAPFFVGLNQINLTIPEGVPSGVQPLVITSNGIPSNTVNIPVQ